MSGFKVEFSVLNLKATPGIYADAFANRPAAGYPGRVFIDTDNPSTGMYRDTGTVWVQIAETATSDVDTLQNVTDNGNTTTNSISVGHASTPVAIIDARTPFTNLNNADSFCVAANTARNITSNASFGVNYVNTVYGFQSLVFNGNATIGNGGINSAGNFINFLNNNTTGTVSVTQAATIRAIAGTQTGIYYNTGAASTVFTHVAALKTLQPINTGSLPALVTNNYGLLVADNTANSGTITYTNRWGIYQEGASDKNYFAANVLIKSTTDNGNALQVTGNANITGNLGLGTSSPTYKLNVLASAGTQAIFQAGQTGVSNGYTINSNGTNLTYQWYNGGNEAMRLDASGNLGLGTSSPQTQLDIANGLMFGTIDAFPSATYDAAAVIAKTGSLGSAPFNNAGSIVYRARVTSTAGRSSHIFYTGSPSTERMRLDESGNLGINTTSTNAAALLQMDSTTKGFLLPRMTDAQINAISNPPDGLMVYSTDQHHIAFYDAGATNWKKVSNSNL